MASSTVSTVGTTNKCSGVERMLYFALIGVGHAHTRNSFRVGACTPHSPDCAPVTGIVLHFGPDKVLTGICHRTINSGIGGVEERTACDFSALHHLDLDQIPDRQLHRSRYLLCD